MGRHRARYACGGLALAALNAGLPAGCAKKAPPAADSGAARTETTGAAAAIGTTVFTDSASFRRVCAEADSGLTPETARRCTPRDQSLRIVPPP